MDRRPIGVFDSGLGGLTCVRRLTELLPGEDIVYLGDTGRVPYGGKGRETICRYGQEDTEFLLRRDVKAIVIACGTVSSNALSEVCAAAGEKPVTGIVGAAASAAVKKSPTGRIGVIATAATIRSGAFGKAIRALCPGAQVLEKACPLFVPLVEDGRVEPGEPLMTLCAREYLEPIRDAGVDTLIMGCTHYPLISRIIGDIMGTGVTLIDSGAETAAAAMETLRARQLTSDRETGGSARYFVTDRTDEFSALASLFLGGSVCAQVQRVSITD